MRITKYKIRTKKINGAYKIALFSDVHYSGSSFNSKKLTKIINNIKENKPDFICLPGDFLDDSSAGKDDLTLLTFFKTISKYAPLIISLGNHDVEIFKKYKPIYKYPDEYFNQIRKIPNVYLLDNEGIKIKNIFFYGYTFYNELYDEENIHKLDKILESKKDFPFLSTDSLNIILSHTPIPFESLSLKRTFKNADLILCGHMHNGAIPLGIDKLYHKNKGIISPNKHLFPKYARGMINDKIIISKGITTIQHCTPPYIRIFNIFYPMNIEYINLEGK